ncbi:putative periplasmic lipoprotein [Rubellimicrobium thermophilum DSM 16684]|uniref:Putative periplasmic lipoprotein n=1 Tax=Rubellimicrobium thermophilum DSM 16684 TaxID=1123069 RepID=S9R667_9RHOB|nr:DUF2291 family protein [Rubellimicrobium thermophilum]EPX87488.1 putative periplasmic lipoprotein [Rubellimicrobium thermophilum DSM 16684]
MIRTLLLCLSATALLTGCKIVQKAPQDGADAPASHVEQVVLDSYETQLLPHVSAAAVEFGTLRAALAGGLEAAGAAHGIQAAGGGAWNFLTRGEGMIVGGDRESRAATLDVDADGDGAGDLQIQIGPIVRGTALRDAAPFYVFTDFKDQIEFADLARALNSRATADLALPGGDLTGRSVAFEGAFALRSATDPILLVPTRLVLEDSE